MAQFGRYFEEFNVGDVYKHWPGRTITESDDMLFCMLTMNHHPLHIDANYAKDSDYGRQVVVGNLVVDIAMGQSVPDVSGKALANLGFEKIEFLAPTFHGDTIYSESEVLEKKESSSRPDRGIVSVETRAHNQEGKLLMRFRRSVMVAKRPAGEAGAETPK
ncbi:MAG: MaoC family dehydratase [Chloroflexi bacterium]|nr:MaoC family dehydratase [Chloroflexota bacterium]